MGAWEPHEILLASVVSLLIVLFVVMIHDQIHRQHDHPRLPSPTATVL